MMIEYPWEYHWSSCGVKTGEKKQAWLDYDPFYDGLGKTRKKREKKYKSWLLESIPEEELKLIRDATQRGQLTGGAKFTDQISEKLGRRIELRGPGRPKKTKK